MKMAIKVGDWIRITPLWPGIWHVSRILSGFKESRWSLAQPAKASDRTLVFCHRLVNDSWKRSFAHQCCELSYVRPLDDDDHQELASLLSNHKLQMAFKKYEQEHDSIDLVTNISLGAMPDHNVNDFLGQCNEILAHRIINGMTVDEVLEVLGEAGFDKFISALPSQVTLQLISANHELRSDEFVYRRYRALSS